MVIGDGMVMKFGTRVDQSARCPVRELAIRELSSYPSTLLGLMPLFCFSFSVNLILNFM